MPKFEFRVNQPVNKKKTKMHLTKINSIVTILCLRHMKKIIEAFFIFVMLLFHTSYFEFFFSKPSYTIFLYFFIRET